MMLINGKPGESVSASDRSLQYGDGLFETLRVRNGRPELWSRHLERLRDGAERLGIPLDTAVLEKEVLQLLSQQVGQDQSQGVLKILLSRGAGGRGYTPPEPAVPVRLLQWHPLPPGLEGRARDGIAVCCCRHPVSLNPALAGLKHNNRLDQVMASRELGSHHAEGLMFEPAGSLIEGTRSNVFLVKGSHLMTPSLESGGVAGIMRGLILELCRDTDHQAQVRPVSRDDLMLATEIFVCNSVMGIQPVIQVDIEQDIRWQNPPGPVTRRIQQLIDERLAS